MRRAILAWLLCLTCACNDDKETSFAVDAGAGSGGDAATPRSLLPRPGTLERVPTALPDDLRPPR